MELREISLVTILIRSVLIYFAPLMLHFVDINLCNEHLVTSYQTKPKKFQIIWSISSFFLLNIIFNLIFPKLSDIEGSLTDFGISKKSKIIIICMSVLSYAVLHWLVIKKAYNLKQTKRS